MDTTHTAVLEEEQSAIDKATPGSATRLIGQIKRHTRKRFSTEDKIRRVWSYLKYHQGMPTNKKHIQRLMKEQNLLVA